MNKNLEKAHKHSLKNKLEVMDSEICGCFYCLKIFKSNEIKNWINNTTAQCPYCMVDSVIGSESGYPITKEFLDQMCKKWFK